MRTLQKSPAERVVHAVAFEVIAPVICAPALSLIMGKPLAQTGVMTIMFALVAMTWNIVFNAGFDRIEKRFGFNRTIPVRIAHACAFEGGLVVFLVPLAAWWMNVGLLEALMLDIGIMLFFLPYTFFYNLGYDHLRARWMARRMQAPNPFA
jgi:uncharacterized membrane protein